MIDVHRFRICVAAVATLCLTVAFAPSSAEAQDGGRFRILVANLQPSGDFDEDWGEDVSDELRDLIDLPTHVAMEDDDIDDAAREYDMRLNDLNCVFAVQLAGQINSPMIFCGTYEISGEMVSYDVKFQTVPGLEEFSTQGQASEDDPEVAAEQILAFFEGTVDRLNQITSCGIAFNSSNYGNAVETCGAALESTPTSREARSALARSYLELERFDEALEQFEVMLENDPANGNALQSAGYAATQAGDREAAREYYSRYLTLNPNDVAVRLRLAYELAQGGDFVGAMELIEPGLESAPDDIDLHEQYGSYAARAALGIIAERGTEPAPAGAVPQLDPEVADLFRKSIVSLSQVLEARGAESLPQYVTNLMAAHIQLGEEEAAIELGERGIQYFPRNANVRNTLANAHNRMGNIDQAIATLEAALEIDPEISNAYTRMGQWLLTEDRVDEAAEALTQAAAREEQPVDVLSDILFAYGYNELFQQGERQAALDVYESARLEGISAEQSTKLDFFSGYGIYEIARIPAEAESSLAVAQQTLPMFQEALRFLTSAQAGGYGDANPGSNLGQFIAATNQFIEIQELIIQRENR